MYMAFLDVTKTYDKAWLDAIMYIMHNEGIRDRHWSIIKKNSTKTSQQKSKPDMEKPEKSTSKIAYDKECYQYWNTEY